MRPATPLTAAELATLEHYSHHASHHRKRRRALAILGHHRGQSLPQLAGLFAVRYATVHEWLSRWQGQGLAGLAGLAEGPRAGRPPKLDAAAKKKQVPGWGRPPSSCVGCCPAWPGSWARP